jgi:hypothetical protein
LNADPYCFEAARRWFAADHAVISAKATRKSPRAGRQIIDVISTPKQSDRPSRGVECVEQLDDARQLRPGEQVRAEPAALV